MAIFSSSSAPTADESEEDPTTACSTGSSRTSSRASCSTPLSSPATTSAPSSVYEERVARLYQTPFFHPINHGLSNIQKLHQLIGHPMDNPDLSIIHIAGTNGKGSVALKLARTLQLLLEQNKSSSSTNHTTNIGLYTSPHVSCLRERIQCNGQLISEAAVADYLDEIFDMCQNHNIPATFFEIVTTMAFLFFRDCHYNNNAMNNNNNNKSIIILEAGLGGRLDATNVITNPLLTILTSVGLDHIHVLGNSHEQIALEKAGIFKPGAQMLVGSRVPHDTLKHHVTHTMQGILDPQDYYTVDQVLQTTTSISLHHSSSSPVSDYDAENARIAMAAISLLQQQSYTLDLPKTISDSLLQRGMAVRPPCRFEIVDPELIGAAADSAASDNSHHRHRKLPTIILDVAHNPPAMQCLVHKLSETFGKTTTDEKKNAPYTTIRFVLGLSKEKDWKGIFECLRPLLLRMADKNKTDNASSSSPLAISKIHLVQANHPKAASLNTLVEDLKHSGILPTTTILDYDLKDTSVERQVNRFISTASSSPQPDHKGAEKEEVIVVCGSVYVMAEVRKVLRIQEPRDSEYLVDAATGRLPGSVLAFGNNELFVR